jgi:hypothetical protein
MLRPIVLQHLPECTLYKLSLIFRASLSLEYIPEIWRLSTAIIIPKIGKEDYSHTRAWRPISLMSFVFKTLKRLILWHLEDTVFKSHGMHGNQHAFQKGRSTKSAPSDTVNYLENKVLRGGFATGIFLDIEGAFDNLLLEGVLESLKKGYPAKLLSWFKNFLLTRKVKVEYQGTTTSRALVKSTPQGGVLSPVLWNLAFDEVLELFDSGPIKVCGYANELVT